MGKDLILHERPASDRLHPLVAIAVVTFTLWFVLAVWGFAGDGYTDYLLVFITGFFLIAGAIPFALWSVWRKYRGGAAADRDNADEETFRDWSLGEFATWQDRVRGANAAIEVVLPIAAAAIGMTAFGIVFAIVMHFSGPGAT